MACLGFRGFAQVASARSPGRRRHQRAAACEKTRQRFRGEGLEFGAQVRRRMPGNTSTVPAPPPRPQPRGTPQPPLSSPPHLRAARRRGSARAPATLRQKRPSDSARARMRSCRVSPRAAHARTVCTRPLKPAASWCPPASSSVGCQPRTYRRPPPSPRPAPPRIPSVRASSVQCDVNTSTQLRW